MKTKFYLASYIYYVKRSNNRLMLYNTKSGEVIERNSIACCNLVDEIYNPSNLGVIDFDENEFKDTEVGSFVEEIVTKNFGNIHQQKKNSPQLINLLPILNLQNDVERLKVNNEFLIGENLLKYLNELTIYINNVCTQNCSYCTEYFKQAKSCYKESTNNCLEISCIKNILDSLAYSSLKKINVLGGNIFSYPYFEELLALIQNYDFQFHLWNHYLNFDNRGDNWTKNKNSIIENIIVTFPLNEDKLNDILSSEKKEKVIHFLIENEFHYEEVEKLIPRLKDYTIMPIYTRKNEAFFRENVFMNKEDIFGEIISHRSIFCNQKLNSNFFGKLYILSDGSFKANMNASILGNIKNDSILEILYKELDQNTAWRKVRDIQPCNDCMYKHLCPPPSNYETIIGKPNLCHVHP